MPASYHSSSMAIWVCFAVKTAQMVLVTTTLAAVAMTCLTVLGTLPWLALPMTLEGNAPIEAGPAVQIGIALFLVTLCGFLPASGRVMQLETSHRRFQTSMEDVARAYYVAHSADRQGVFRLTNEFDAVRERLAFLRNHPDLSALEPEVIELAAQMSHVGRDLARIYSDEKVATARNLLAQRGDQAARIEADVIRAMRVTEELVASLANVEGQEEQVAARITRLRTELDVLLPRLGLAAEPAERTVPEGTLVPSAEKTWREDKASNLSVAVARG